MNAPFATGQIATAFDRDSLATLLSEVSLLVARQARPVVVSICGGSSTGKSTQLTAAFRSALQDEIEVVEQDCFMGLVADDALDPVYRWDHPSHYRTLQTANALARLKIGQSFEVPVYDFQTRSVTGYRSVLPKPIVVIEGLYANHGPLSQACDYSIYLEAPLKDRLVKRVFRNRHERYRNADASRTVEGFFASVEPAHQRFVRTQRPTADMVLQAHYRFADTVDRFACVPLSAYTASDDWSPWCTLSDATLLVKQGSHPRLALVHKNHFYLNSAISLETLQALNSSDPGTL